MLVGFALVEQEVDLGGLKSGYFQVEGEFNFVEKFELAREEFEVSSAVFGEFIIGD